MAKNNIEPITPPAIEPVIRQEVQAATTEGEAVAQEEAASALGSGQDEDAAKVEALEALAAEQALELEALKAAAPAPALSFDTPFEVEGKRYAFKSPGRISVQLKDDQGRKARREFNKLDALNDAQLLAVLVAQHPHLFTEL